MKKRKYVTIKPRGQHPFELRAGRMIQPFQEVWRRFQHTSREHYRDDAYSVTRSEVRHVLKEHAQEFTGRTGNEVDTFRLTFHPSGAVSFGCCRFSAEDVRKLKRWACAKKKA